jgi:hypothetical protein
MSLSVVAGLVSGLCCGLRLTDFGWLTDFGFGE